MEKDPSVGRVGLKKSKKFEEFLRQNNFYRRTAYGVLAVWSASVGIAGVKNLSNEESVIYDEEALAYIDDINDQALEGSIALGDGTMIDTQLVAEPSALLTPTTLELTPAQKLGLEIDPRIESAMTGMEELTVEGYNQFLNSIDSSPIEYSSQFREFNQDLISSLVEQKQSEIFNLHLTVAYANDQPGFGSEMLGNFNVLNMVKSMALRGEGINTQCCGINWMIGRAANTYQTAPLNAKLNHNPPYDGIATGVEIEANEQASITSDQYVEAGYLSIAVLDTQELLGRKPLSEILQGHGEMRDRIIDEWNATHSPNERLGVRDDFDFPESELFRYYVQQFLDRHPEIIGQKPLARLP